jgi:uncharacterized protein YbaR (Trm112 family)
MAWHDSTAATRARRANNPFLSVERLPYNHGMLDKDLLEILVCPECKAELVYRHDPERLKCTQCHRVYPVKDDIPIMLVDEARIENE